MENGKELGADPEIFYVVNFGATLQNWIVVKADCRGAVCRKMNEFFQLNRLEEWKPETPFNIHAEFHGRTKARQYIYHNRKRGDWTFSQTWPSAKLGATV